MLATRARSLVEPTLLHVVLRRARLVPLRRGQRWIQAAADGGWTNLPNGIRMQQVERGDFDERQVTRGQTVRIAYAAWLDDGTECAREESSFRLGQGAVCEALDEGVVGMCVGDVRRLRASGYARRGRALAGAPPGEMLEYNVRLTGAVFHMTIVTIPKPGSDDPLLMMWDFLRRSVPSVFGKLPTAKRS